LGKSSTERIQPKTWGGFWDIFGKILVELLKIEEGECVLDFGTGGGSVLFPASMKIAPSGRVVGIEKREHLVKRTSGEINRCGTKNAEIHLMDGREMTFDDNSFDHVAAGFIGWDDYFDFVQLEYKRPDPMIKEIHRVLKPGGPFGLSTWLIQEDLDWMFQFLTARSINCKKNYSAENERGWKIIMVAGGFNDVQFFPQSVSFTYESKDAWWKEMMDYDWTKDENDKELMTDALREQAFHEVQDHTTDDGGVQFTRDALIVIGRK